MFRRRLVRLAVLLVALGVVVAACGADDSAAEAPDTTLGAEDDHTENTEEGTDHEFTFGEPGDAAASDRVVEVDANDTLTFDPAELTVSAGETVTFVITNTGVIPHDFTLGDEATQDAHEKEMAEMAASGEMGEHADPNAVVLEPGETKELTWTFTEAGDVLIGCHQPGHYAGGMKGTVVVEG